MSRRMAIAAEQIPSNSWADDIPSSPPANSQPKAPAQLPPWGQQLMADLDWLKKAVEEQEQQIRAREEELKNMQTLILENNELRMALESAKERIAELEKADLPAGIIAGDTASASLTMEVDARHDLMGSVHAPTEQEWEVNKSKREKQRTIQDEQQLRKDERMQRKFDLLEQRQQRKQQQQPTSHTANSYVSIASRNLPPKKHVTKTTRPPSDKQVQWAQRVFTAVDNTSPEYTIVYMASPRRTSHSEIRRALRLLGVAPERAIDVQFPAHGIVGLLINRSYQQDLCTILKTAKVKTKEDFNPTSESTIGDTKWREKSVEERTTYAKLIYQERILAMCLRMPKPYLGFAILRYFNKLAANDPHHIGDAYLNNFREKHPKPVRHSRPVLVSTEDTRQLLGDNLGARIVIEDTHMHDT